MKKVLIICCFIVLNGCTGYPDNIKPVKDFQLEKYLGTWYEVARLDHSFERNMQQVTATYTMRDDGGVRVLNQGYDTKKQSHKDAVGRAYFVQDERTGHLKVSFFGPFFGSYVVFELGSDYQYAFVAGNDYDYLWLLARTPQVEAAVKQRFVELAAEKGFAIDELIWVQH
jgi:apolipoprotein D and lipocalin family protein